MDRNLDQLKIAFEGLVPAGAKFRPDAKIAKPGKMDYILGLQDYFIDQERSAGTLLPGREWVAQNMESPMLAQATSRLEGALDTALDSPQYMGDLKCDGVRMLVFYTPEFGFEFMSRNRSVTDYCLGYYRNQIKGLTGDETIGMFKQSFCLDCELTSVNPNIAGRGVVTESILQAVDSLLALDRVSSWKAQEDAGYPLRFNVFDIVFFNGKSIMHEPYAKRLALVDKIVPAIRDKIGGGDMRSNWFLTVPRCGVSRAEKEAFYESVIEDMGEGVILKHLDAPYQAVTARGGKQAPYLKMKRTVSESLNMDIDAFVIGGRPGTPGKANENVISILDFGVYLQPSGKLHHIASCSGITQEMREKITDYSSGKPTLHSWMLNKVAAINGLDISPRSKRFMHSVIQRWRTDSADSKRPEECVFDEVMLDTLIGR